MIEKVLLLGDLFEQGPSLPPSLRKSL